MALSGKARTVHKRYSRRVADFASPHSVKSMILDRKVPELRIKLSMCLLTV